MKNKIIKKERKRREKIKKGQKMNGIKEIFSIRCKLCQKEILFEYQKLSSHLYSGHSLGISKYINLFLRKAFIINKFLNFFMFCFN